MDYQAEYIKLQSILIDIIDYLEDEHMEIFPSFLFKKLCRADVSVIKDVHDINNEFKIFDSLKKIAPDIPRNKVEEPIERLFEKYGYWNLLVRLENDVENIYRNQDMKRNDELSNKFTE